MAFLEALMVLCHARKRRTAVRLVGPVASAHPLRSAGAPRASRRIL